MFLLVIALLYKAFYNIKNKIISFFFVDWKCTAHYPLK
ncbi:hypothetical protein [Phage Phass-1]|uniref:Uncharacterized protein n=1 Tax=Phage Phass-1 TaxID=3043662 RepID=A0AAF0RU79_9CAUD|nr:hypothetical protein [Phage Phass-1]